MQQDIIIAIIFLVIVIPIVLSNVFRREDYGYSDRTIYVFTSLLISILLLAAIAYFCAVFHNQNGYFYTLQNSNKFLTSAGFMVLVTSVYCCAGGLKYSRELLAILVYVVCVVSLAINALYTFPTIFGINSIEYMISLFKLVFAPDEFIWHAACINNANAGVYFLNCEQSFVLDTENDKVRNLIYYFSLSYPIISYLKDYFIDEKRLNSKGENIYDNSLVRFFFFAVLFISVIVSMLLSNYTVRSVTIFSGIAGVALSLAFRDLLNNFIAGVIIKWDGTVNEGQYIVVDNDTEGTVKKISLRYTLLETRDKIDSMVPNSKFLSTDIMNYSTQGGDVRLSLQFRLSRDISPESVKKDIEGKIGLCSNRILTNVNNQPKVFLISSDDISNTFDLRFWIRDPQKGIGNIKSEALFYIHNMFGDRPISQLVQYENKQIFS